MMSIRKRRNWWRRSKTQHDDQKLGGGGMAIFYRVEFAVASVGRCADEAGDTVYFRAWRGTEFYGRKEIKDAGVSAGDCVNPDDGISLERIAKCAAPRGLGDMSLLKIADYAGESD